MWLDRLIVDRGGKDKWDGFSDVVSRARSSSFGRAHAFAVAVLPERNISTVQKTTSEANTSYAKARPW